MGTFFVCKHCHSNVYLIEQKEEFQFPLRITCNVCRKQRTYFEYEVLQERYDLLCSNCKGRFFIRRMPPITIHCPHCLSRFYVSGDGSLIIIQRERQPLTTQGATITGALGGFALGTMLAGAGGGILGALAGAALGASADVKEAYYD